MPNVFVMPKIGLTMTEGSVVEWQVGEGQSFAAGQVYVVVETDKVTNEIEAPEAGTLTRILVQTGETVDVGTPIAEWEAAGAAAAASAAPAAAAPAPAPAAAAAPAIGPRRRAATPLEASAARRLAEAKQTIPHFYLASEFAAAPLQAAREAWNVAHPNARATVTHVLLAALARALAANADLNRVWDNGEIVEFDQVDLGIAVDTVNGLVVPVLRNAAALNLTDLITRSNDLVTRARDGKLTNDDVGGGVLTLSNAGMHDVTQMTSIIPPGQAAILGVGSERALFRPDANGVPALHREIGVVLSCDHRVLDGVRGLRLLNAVRALLAEPAALFA